ncbi:hypothetical protein IWX47DRAFT_281485 [Phyllosticta citricarpa]
MSYTPFPPLFPSLSHHSPHLPSSIRSVLVIRTRILHPLCLLLDAILILDNPAAQPFQQARRGLRRRPRTTLALANDNGTAAAPLGAARLGLGALGFGDAVRGPRAQLAPLPRAPPPLQLVVDLAAAPRAARPLPERRRFRAAPDAAAAVATAARRSRVALGTRAHGGGAGHCAREAGVGSAEALGFVGGEVVVPRRRRSRRRGRGEGVGEEDAMWICGVAAARAAAWDEEEEERRMQHGIFPCGVAVDWLRLASSWQLRGNPDPASWLSASKLAGTSRVCFDLTSTPPPDHPSPVWHHHRPSPPHLAADTSETVGSWLT